MANVLKMADQAAIIALWERGWSRRNRPAKHIFNLTSL